MPLLVVTRQRRIRRYIKWRGNLAPTACCAATMDLGTDEGVCPTDYGSIFIIGRPSPEGRPYIAWSPPEADSRLPKFTTKRARLVPVYGFVQGLSGRAVHMV